MVLDRHLVIFLFFFLRGIEVGNFEYRLNVTSSQSKRNKFEIILGNITNKTPEEIHYDLEDISQNGFLNFFGPQKFNVNRSNTKKRTTEKKKNAKRLES